MNSSIHVYPSPTRCLIFEYLTAGGQLDPNFQSAENLQSLTSEGLTMLTTFASHLAKSTDYTVNVLVGNKLDLDPRIEQVEVGRQSIEKALIKLARVCDRFMLIAPETDRVAERFCRLLKSIQHKSISPDTKFTKLAGDKLQTNHWLESFKVPIPRQANRLVQSPTKTAIPSTSVSFKNAPSLICKPRWGTGGTGLRRIGSDQTNPRQFDESAEFIEPFVEGISVSVSVVQGPKQTLYLPATRQILAFKENSCIPCGYLGSKYPLNAGHANRAKRLAETAVANLPEFVGYIGIDMILASEPSRDCIVDINPRLTSSYLLLEEICDGNLAETIVKISCGQTVQPTFQCKKCQFRLGESRMTDSQNG